MEWLGMIPFVAYWLLILWFFITIMYLLKLLIDTFRVRTNSRIELEKLQRIELEKRITLLDKQLAEKEKIDL
ncbi:hypothetical protein ACMGE7_08530 [Macrococcus equi]|uniref:hypothetical protein n=1 Tax=Macrococcus equi TaxID=3395462 RepID=UPI0039BEB62E